MLSFVLAALLSAPARGGQPSVGSVSIRGKVTNESGAPVAGVTVSVAGAATGQILAPAPTAADGAFTLTVPAGGVVTLCAQPAPGGGYMPSCQVKPETVDLRSPISAVVVRDIRLRTATRLEITIDDPKAVLAGLASSPGLPAIAIQAYTEIGTIQPLRLDRSARTSRTYVLDLAQGSAVRLLWTGNGLRLTDADSAVEWPKAQFRNVQPGAAERLVQVRLRAAAE